ncbi:MAG: imidazolonepropionase-like amidohydrolase [Cyclobacteriaceae bacterium]|jgi:imidazolonepropionase-like amidohydrolase
MMKVHFLLISFLFTIGCLSAQIEEAPERQRGDGPFNQLIIRGATMINGNGAPPMGPVDIVVEGNKIVSIKNVGYPGVPIDEARRPQLKEGGKEIDAHGQFVMPGLIDMHGHIGGKSQGTPSEYVFKLWMAHGITTIRDPSAGNGLKWVLDHKQKSANNSITAPRILAYTSFGQNLSEVATVRPATSKNAAEKLSGPITNASEAKAWVQANYRRGADGVKFFGAAPEVMDAALRENKALGLRSACHHAQLNVTWWNVVNSAEAGLTSMEHWYGLPEAMFTDRIVQNYPSDYNYQNEQDRFGEAGKLWKQAAPPYSDKWNEVMNRLIELDFTLDPTFNIYEASRDLMRTMRAEWHQDYTLPSLWKFYEPSKVSHGSYWHSWSTEHEVEWKNNYKLWMTFVNEYKNRGGRVTTGSDSGFIYQLYGFAYVRELELLQEAGFHPLEVIRSATLMGAQALGMEDQIGTIEIGKLADLVIVSENPLENLKVLYGTGAIKLTEDNQIIRAGGVRYTIKDGIVYDAKELLADVRKIVEEAKKDAGIETLPNPGYPNWEE